MKNIFRLLAPLALAFSGCVYEELPNNELVQSEGRIFTASLEQDETRTYVEEGNLLRWNAGDQITLFDGNTLNRQYQFDGETGDNSGTFSIVNAPYGSGNDLNANYAVYPYASDIKITEAGVITVTVPAEQNYAENSFGLGANTMVAVTENHDDTFLKFKNVGGYLKLQLYGDDVTVKSIELTGNGNEKIAGKASITPTYSDEPKISMSDDATSSITLSCGKGVKIGSTAENATAFWIVVPPTIFEGGFTITITDINDETFTKSTSNEIAIERNVIKPMKAFEVIFENETEDEGSSNDYIDEYGVNHGPGVEIDGVVWAPVNCGYHEIDYPYGKLYQWGRKYGQGYDNADKSYPSGSNIEVGPVTILVGQSVDNMDRFYKISQTPYDWLSQQNDMLWNSGSNSNPTKTEYDPCPNGWRVPTNAELENLSKSRSAWTTDENAQSGFWFSGSTSYASSVNQIFLPAAGSRGFDDGIAYSRNAGGRYWSSDVNSYNAYDLNFGSSYCQIGKHSRSNGYSVRCVQDLTEDSDAPSVQPEEDTYIDEYGINHGAGIEIDGVIWAPVNCGYHETDYPYGKLYQWGRKYGQGYDGQLYNGDWVVIGTHSDSEIPTILNGSVSIDDAQSEDNKNKFYTSGSWFTSDNYKLWNNGTETNPIKTDYEPCPHGWRVPTFEELDNLTNRCSSWTTDSSGHGGRWFSGSAPYTEQVPQVFLPAAGFRNSNGATSNRGSDGRYWSSLKTYSRSDEEYKMRYIKFSSNEIDDNKTSSAVGYSIRCVHE